MRIHKAAKALPDMLEDEFLALTNDIRSHGLLCPIELLDGAVIDGRHRLKACQVLGIEAGTVEVSLNGQSPAEYVWSLNGARRHLSASQRAAVAVELLPVLKQEAKERMSSGGKGVAPVPPLDTGKSRDKAAEIVGVGSRYVSDAEKIKNESPELFEEIKSGEKTVKKAAKELKQNAKAEEDKKAATKAKRMIAKQKEAGGVHHGDSFVIGRDIPGASCALIFTDPPYDRKSLHLFCELGMLASKILVDGGSLITFAGQYVMREVIEAVAPEWTNDEIDDDRVPPTDWLDEDGSEVYNDMHLFWVNCCLHTGDTAQMREYGIKVKWKPMLWFVKGSFRRDRETWVEDLVESRQEKDAHPWQQSVLEASYYIEKLTSAGELVVDPFCGGGTTALAAKRLGREWWTADIEARHVATARGRLKP